MHDEIEQLVRLQHVDDDIRLLEGKAKSIPQQIEKIEQDTAEKKAAVELLKAQQEEMARARRQCETEAEDLSGKIQKLELQVYQVKTNKEYQALLQEIEDCKEAKSGKENEIIGLMEEEEKTAEQIKRAAMEFEAHGKSADSHITDFKTALGETEALLEAARQQRGDLLSLLSAEVRSRYERVFSSLNGRAVVTVRKNSCGGCYTALPPQTVNEIRKKERIITCEVCGRILVWDESQGQ